MSDLIAIDEARRRIMAAARPLGSAEVGLDEALGRALAEDLASEFDIPSFRSSAMDGFAVLSGPGGELRVIGESRAGRPADARVELGTAVRISTGAAVPEGADAVVPVERTEPARDGAVSVPAMQPGANLREPGEDVREGEVVLRASTRLGPAELGVAASLGRRTLRCALRPRVAILVTGDELVEPGQERGPGGIYSSNGYALAGQVERAGAEVVRRDTARDTVDETLGALRGALEDADVLCISGGMSVGPHDHVKPALRELGVEERFWGVSLKPGKPTWFGVSGDGAGVGGDGPRGERLVFGLPGNPVSAMVTFQLFARPALAALQGTDPEAARAEAVLDEPVARSPRREQAIRCRLRHGADGWHATPTGPQGSHILTSMLGADALALVPAGEGRLAAGERVTIELL
jgi:molybdopterin molybdotransferase